MKSSFRISESIPIQRGTRSSARFKLRRRLSTLLVQAPKWDRMRSIQPGTTILYDVLLPHGEVPSDVTPQVPLTSVSVTQGS